MNKKTKDMPKRAISLTESGRIIDTTGFPDSPILEYIDGSWTNACSPLLLDDIFNGRKISEQELEMLKNERK
ncbi:MAG: hypothetical protein Q4B65_01190 [Candidatus Saccharibacteria bacterium]|nr:hypothetical protein [Candidatus Saccharibacteria bacterium]